MDLVIDANILFSILIKRGRTEDVIFETTMHLYAPEFIFMEFSKYEKLLLKKTERTSEEFYQLLGIIKERIKIIPNEYTTSFITQAGKICPDPDDIEYFAIALILHCPIWSNDKELKNQKIIQVYSTGELLNILY